MRSNFRHRDTSRTGCVPRKVITRTCPGGFTLIEMIIVLLIIAVTAALVGPRIGASWKRLEEGDFLRDFTEVINRARINAINSGRPVSFRLNSGERTYGISAQMRGSIPQNVEIFSEHLEKDPETGDYFIIFYPDGSLVGHNFDVVFDQSRTYRVGIDPLFGTVKTARINAR